MLLFRFCREFVLLLGLRPRGFFVGEKDEDLFAGLLRGIYFEPGDRTFAVAAEVFRWDVAITVRNDADHGVGFAGQPRAFFGGLPRQG